MPTDIVLFGGTFDPVHNGHLIVARALAEQRGYERITLVPAASPPHKGAAEASGEDRLAMLRLAVAGEELFDICELELRRAGPSYTHDTLRELRGRHGGAANLHWVIGADMLEDLPNWYRGRDVVEMANLIVAVRPPWDRRLPAIWANLASDFPSDWIQAVSKQVITVPLIDISSTEIRRRVAGGLSIQYLVPQTVEAYIAGHHLYHRGNNSSRGAFSPVYG